MGAGPSDPRSSISAWKEVAHFQIAVAEQWRKEAQTQLERPALEFVSLFAALNSLYWLWAKVDGFQGTEREDLEHLLGKLSANDATAILMNADVERAIQHLTSRGPVRRMDRRTAANGLGDPTEGIRYLKALVQGQDVAERLKALMSITYLIRCNLVHGSKETVGPDLALIAKIISPLRLVLDATLQVTTELNGSSQV